MESLLWIQAMIPTTCGPSSMQLTTSGPSLSLLRHPKEERKARLALESESPPKVGSSVDHMTFNFCWGSEVQDIVRSLGDDDKVLGYRHVGPTHSVIFLLCTHEDLTVLGPCLGSVLKFLCWSPQGSGVVFVIFTRTFAISHHL